jgi:hypothetical protein
MTKLLKKFFAPHKFSVDISLSEEEEEEEEEF